MFTTISFYIALFTALVFPISIFLSLSTSNESAHSLLAAPVLISSLASLFALPFSIVSLFSKEHLAKRIFAILVNLLPIAIIVYGLTLEVMDEFFRPAP
ncbi:2-acyl-glycerophospho-ethanolamine acyltransferase [Planomicrobium sp. CPCC 101079]|nr:2-acyl-glycerophospho-ethanolamine acyltransferase [Planomicrobium sp. CPCC 101079]